MPKLDWVCTECGSNLERGEVVLKRVVFLRPAPTGRSWSNVKSVTIGHLCDYCLNKDAAFNTDGRHGKPITSA